MTNIRKFISLLFAAVLFSSISTQSFAIDKLHFLIGGGAGGGWDGTARGTGEALTKAGFLKSASFENMSGGGGGKALSFLINTKPAGTVLVQSTPLVLRSITRHKGYVKGSGVLSYKDVVPIAGVIGDYGAIAVPKNSPFKNFKDVVAAYKANPKSVKMAGGSVRGSMDHLIGALAFQEAGADPNQVVYVPYDAGGKALAGLLSGETFTNIPTGATVVITTPYGFKVGPFDYTVSLGLGSYTGNFEPEDSSEPTTEFNPMFIGLGGNLTLAGFVFAEGHLGLVGEGPGFRGFAGMTLERLMKKGLNLPFNLLVGSELFYSTDMAGVGNSSGWAAFGLRLDYGF